VIDAGARTLRMASSGGPPILAFRSDGAVRELDASGVPFGVMEGLTYEELAVDLEAGDTLLMFSDGAYEVHDARDTMLGVDGLVGLLRGRGYPESRFEDIAKAIEEDLLKSSNAIRLADDLTFIEARFTA